MALEVISQFDGTANRYLEVSYNGLPLTLTHFHENILKFVRRTSTTAMVRLCFHFQNDATLLKELQQCLNWHYHACTSFSLYILGGTTERHRVEGRELRRQVRY